MAADLRAREASWSAAALRRFDWTEFLAARKIEAMKPRVSQQKTAALTRVEVVVVVFVMGILLAMLLPALSKAKRRASHINCENSIKQIELAFRIWAEYHNDKFPMEVSLVNGGTMELVVTGDVVTTFQVMSNELLTPRIVVCYSDAGHEEATNFAVNFTAKNISYFISIDVSHDQPNNLNLGDDNLLVDGQPVASGVLNLWTNSAAWTRERHHSTGNIGLNDGSVQSGIIRIGFNSFPGTYCTTNRLAIP
jgi:competence protein ComGC